MSSLEGGALRLLPKAQGNTPRFAADLIITMYASAKNPGLTVVCPTPGVIEKPVRQPMLAGHQRWMRGARQPLVRPTMCSIPASLAATAKVTAP